MLYLRDLVKSFDGGKGHGNVRAVDGVSVTVEEGMLLALLGPSGCGKTTSLRMVAGLEQPDSGTIAVGSRVLFSREQRINVPTHRRGLGMVFQSYAIWPHLTVRKNIEFALKGLRGDRAVPRAQLSSRVEKYLALVGLDHLADRSATKLSGGQQQRLALARALAAEPPVLLLDEPLSNLDMKLREGLRLELKRMQRDLGVTTLYVTHDQIEAMAMANVVAIMHAGTVVQADAPRAIYNFPETRFVADFVGKINFIRGTLLRAEGDTDWLVDTPLGTLFARSRSPRAVGGEIAVGVRPENVVLRRSADRDAENTWEGTVQRRVFLGESVDYVVRIGDVDVRVRSVPENVAREGDRVAVCLPRSDCAVMEAS